MSKERYRRGAHTVTDFKYHFVWKTKYSYSVLKRDLVLRLRGITRDVCTKNKNVSGQGQYSPKSHPYSGQRPIVSFISKNNATCER